MYWVGSLLVAASAMIHYHLWPTGYRHIHIIGPLFLLQAIVGIAIAVAIAVTRHFAAAIVGALFVTGTIGDLVISSQIGLFGFRDSFAAPYALMSLIFEGTSTIALVTAAFASLHDHP
jgi:hypothetical protein